MRTEKAEATEILQKKVLNYLAEIKKYWLKLQFWIYTSVWGMWHVEVLDNLYGLCWKRPWMDMRGGKTREMPKS